MALLLLGLVTAAGCGEIDGGNTPFAGTTVYQSPTGEYQFNLLEPPWRQVPGTGDPVFVVPPKIVTLIPTEGDALYSLHIYRQNTDAASALQADAPQRNGSVGSSGPVTVAGSGGSSGVEMSWTTGPAVFHRDAYIDLPSSGGSYRLHFSAGVPLADDGMISQMIVSFRPIGSGQ